MFTWIQTVFQKHHRALFVVLLVIIVFTFVLTIGNQSFFGSGMGVQYAKQDFYGYNLVDNRDLARIIGQGEISATLNPQLRVQQNVQDYALARVAGIALANEMGIPGPTRQQLEDYIRGKEVFQNDSGQFDPSTYNNFVMMLSLQSRMTEDAVAEVLRNDYRLERLSNILGGPGFIHPYAAQVELQDNETVWSLNVATVRLADFDPQIDPSEEALREFYEQSPARFQEPEKMRATAVRFLSENYLSQVKEPSEQELMAYFERNKSRFQQPPPAPAEGEEPQEPAEPVFEDARDQVAAAVREERARRLAAEAADEFTVALWRGKVEQGSDAFDQLVQKMGGQIEEIEPFARNRPPLLTGIPRTAFESAWVSTMGDRYFSDAAQTGNGAVVLIKEEVIPSRVPPLEEVRDLVSAQYVQEERRRLFTEHGEQLRQQLIAAVEAGQSFAEAAEELGMEVQSYGQFKASEAEPMVQFMILPQARNLDAGEISPMRIQGATGQLIHVAQKDVPQLENTAPEQAHVLAEFSSTMDPWQLYGDLAKRRLAAYAPETEPTE